MQHEATHTSSAPPLNALAAPTLRPDQVFVGSFAAIACTSLLLVVIARLHEAVRSQTRRRQIQTLEKLWHSSPNQAD